MREKNSHTNNPKIGNRFTGKTELLKDEEKKHPRPLLVYKGKFYFQL